MEIPLIHVPLHDLLKFIIGIINTLHTLTILLDSLMGILCICVIVLCMCTMVLNCVCGHYQFNSFN